MFDPPNAYIPFEETYVYTINSVRIKKYDPQVVGYCNNNTHKGFLTRHDINEHQCKTKECPFLRKNPFNKEYWENYTEKQEREEERRERRRKAQREFKAFGDAIKEKHESIIRRGNVWLQENGYGGIVEVTGIRFDKKEGMVVVTYVSDRKLDRLEFADIYSYLRVQVGRATWLTRVKRQNGEFATLEEWHNSEKYRKMMQERGDTDGKLV